MHMLAAPLAQVLCVVSSLCAPQPRDHEPNIGPGQYPQYRQISGLAGGGYGLDEAGRESLSGPTAFSTPIGYVLGHDRFQIAASLESFNSTPAVGIGTSNGHALVSYGHTFGAFNVMASDLVKSHYLDNAYNVQAGVLADSRSGLALSVGVQDVRGVGGSAGYGIPTDMNSSRSLFGVMTGRLRSWGGTYYLSAGAGTHRFGKGFASVSHQIVVPVRTWVEYDGWGINEGVLITRPMRAGKAALAFNGDVALIRSRFFTISTGIGF